MEQGPLRCGENLTGLKEQTETRMIHVITISKEILETFVVQLCTWEGRSWMKEISEVSLLKCCRHIYCRQYGRHNVFSYALCTTTEFLMKKAVLRIM